MKQTIKPGSVPDAWNPEALYTKAQRYAERIYQPDVEDWEKALWAGLSLELLARSALANVNPALLADVSDKNWQSLFSALGFNPTESKFSPKSLAITDVLRRLGSIFLAFTQENESFCSLHIGKRNAELHSGDPIFNGLPVSSWQPKYYRACLILLATMQLKLEDYIGGVEAATATKLIAAAADDSAKAVKGDVTAHATVWTSKGKEEQDSLIGQAQAWALRHVGHRVKCPSCNSVALVGGEPIGSPHTKLSDDEIVETHEFLPTHFECVACGLKISGLSKLDVMKLGDRFKKTSTYSAAEFYAPDNEYEGYDDDNNEPM